MVIVTLCNLHLHVYNYSLMATFKIIYIYIYIYMDYQITFNIVIITESRMLIYDIGNCELLINLFHSIYGMV